MTDSQITINFNTMMTKRLFPSFIATLALLLVSSSLFAQYDDIYYNPDEAYETTNYSDQSTNYSEEFAEDDYQDDGYAYDDDNYDYQYSSGFVGSAVLSMDSTTLIRFM